MHRLDVIRAGEGAGIYPIAYGEGDGVEAGCGVDVGWQQQCAGVALPVAIRPC